MKLIIDIDDNDYELLNKTGIEIDWNTAWNNKEKDRKMTFAIFDLVKALKNGTIYNPTVEITEKQAILLLINSGWLVNHDKELRERWERPQGEWITHRVAFHLTCPFCGCNLRALKSEVFEGDYDYNFCLNCGADLRKPNCVRCDHFGDCDGCEKGEEE